MLVGVFYRELPMGTAELKDEFLHHDQPMPVGTELVLRLDNGKERTVRVCSVVEAVRGQSPGMFIE